MSNAVKAAMSKYIGKEPEEGSTLSKVDLISTFQFYSEIYTKKDAIAFVSSNEDVAETLEDRDTSRITLTMGWVARLLSRNVELPLRDSGETFSEWLIAEVEKLPKSVEKSSDKIRHSESDVIIAEIESWLDEDKSAEDIIASIVSLGANKLTMSRIAAYYSPILEEMLSIDTDEQLKEAYSHMTKREIAKSIKRLDSLVTFAKINSKRVTKKSLSMQKPKKVVKTVVIVNENNNEVKFVTNGSNALTLVGKKYLEFNAKKSYAKKVDDLVAVEALIKNAKGTAEALEILKNAKGKEFSISTVVVNKYCRVIKEV